MAPVVQRVSEEFTELGEGPHWDIASQTLYYVDIFGKSILRYNPTTNKVTKANVGTKYVSFILPVEGEEDKFVIGFGRDLVVVKWDSVTIVTEVLTKLGEVDDTPEGRENRINDGKCDPAGRVWFGTSGPEPNKGHIDPNLGSLFSFKKGEGVKTHLTNITLSNGLAWNVELKKLYYIDSLRNETIYEYDVDFQKGVISNGKPIFTLSKHNIPGFPDGMTIDKDGNLWVAIFNGYRVIKIDPKNPETLLETIELPAKQVTSVIFGGKNLDELYVTTAAVTVDGLELSPPDNGTLYKITGLGAKGHPGFNVKL